MKAVFTFISFSKNSKEESGINFIRGGKKLVNDTTNRITQNVA